MSHIAYYGEDTAQSTKAYEPFKPTSFFSKVAYIFKSYREDRTNIAVLSKMSDRELRDIGINRYDIERMVRGEK